MNALPRRTAIATSFTCLVMSRQPSATAEPEALGGSDGIPVTAAEDLMREHGVLHRLMLVYEATLAPAALTLENIHEVLHGAASLVRSFVEDYHGGIEEELVFPEFERQRTHTALVAALREQHRVGRALTDVVLRQATAEGFADESTRSQLKHACRDFIHMFRAHTAWEDTELFPALRRLLSPARLAELGERLEEIERRKIGHDGFAETMRKVSRLEHHAGIKSLGMYTPHTQAD